MNSTLPAIPPLTRCRQRRLALACRPFHSLPVGQLPSLPALWLLSMAWGNFGYSAGTRYLRQVSRLAIRTRSDVLECGSGATTLLLGLLGQRHHFKVVCFEHEPRWAAWMQANLLAADLHNVQVHCLSLRSYGEFDWYDVDGLDSLPTFGTVVCDGPPASIHGGRYGLLPVMQKRLADHCTILLDDTHRRRENQVVAAWATLRPCTITRHRFIKAHSELTFQPCHT